MWTTLPTICLPVSHFVRYDVSKLTPKFVFWSTSLTISSRLFQRPGQEEGNIDFVESSGFGKYSSDPKEIAADVSSWLKNPKKMQVMQQAALSTAKPSATLDIARELAQIAISTNNIRKDEWLES